MAGYDRGTKAALVNLPSSCLNKAADGELVFLLREKDPLFANVVRVWAAQAVNVHEADKVAEAYDIANQAAGRRADRYPKT